VIAARQEYMPCGRTRADAAAEQAARVARQATLKRCRSLAAIAFVDGLGADAGAAAAPDADACARGSQGSSGGGERPAAAVAGGRPWWDGTGLDPSGLLLEHPVSGAGAATGQPDDAVDAAAGGRRLSFAARGSTTATQPRLAAGASRAASPAAPGARRGTGAIVRPSSSRPPPASAQGAPPSTASGQGASAAPDAQAAGAGGSARVRAQLARLLQADGLQRLAAAYAALPGPEAAAVVALLFDMPCGPHAAARLLEALSPVTAARLLLEPPLDTSDALLPAPVRARVLQLLPAPARANVHAAAAAVAAAASVRSAADLAALREFAWGRCVTARQLVAVLAALPPGAPEDRCSAVVTLWSRVVDRGSMVEVFEALSGAEQLELMRRLGPYLVWSTLARPEGLHFRWVGQDDGVQPWRLHAALRLSTGRPPLQRKHQAAPPLPWRAAQRLDLTQPEQRDVARDVVKVGWWGRRWRGTAHSHSAAAALLASAACAHRLPAGPRQVAVRKSMTEKARTGVRVRQLLALTAEGKALADPEDEKLWLSLESKHRLLEFDYARWVPLGGRL
jgi:hypothetical protein